VWHSAANTGDVGIEQTPGTIFAAAGLKFNGVGCQVLVMDLACSIVQLDLLLDGCHDAGLAATPGRDYAVHIQALDVVVKVPA
jgi:hypothetical protein